MDDFGNLIYWSRISGGGNYLYLLVVGSPKVFDVKEL